MALIAWMVIDRVRILRTGTEVTLRTRPLDPRDFLRGDYVTLGYDISALPAGELEERRFEQRWSSSKWRPIRRIL